MPLTRAEFAAAANVSRETLKRFETYDALLLDWSARHNLVARASIEDRWRRHFLDCAQLYPLVPAASRTLVDLGSGAGFPGLVLAAMGQERGLKTFLIESVGKKAAFLRAAAAAMGLSNVEVIPERIEKVKISPPDVVTARALAPLDKLLSFVHEFAGPSTLALLPKGLDVEVELTQAAKSWHMELMRHPSATSAGSTILAIRRITPRRRAKP